MTDLLQALFDNTPDAILLTDDDARCIGANPAACALLGYSLEEVLQMTLTDIVPEPDADLSRAPWQAFMGAGQQKGVCSLQRKDGTIVEVEYYAVTDVVPGVHLLILREIEQRHRQIARALLEISSTVASSLDLGHILLTLANRLLQISGFHRCALYEWDGERGHVSLLVEHARSVWLPEGGKVYHLGDCPASKQVLTSGTPEIIDIGGAEQGKVGVDKNVRQGLATLLILPLHSTTEIIGLVEVGSARRGFTFDPATVSRCEKTLQEATSWLSDPFSNNPGNKLLALAEQLVEVSGGSMCTISSWRASEGVLSTVVECSDLIWSPGEGPVYRLSDNPNMVKALEQNASVATRVDRQTSDHIGRGEMARWSSRALVVQPLSVQGRTIGFMEIHHTSEERVVDEEELRVWQAVADQAAIAIRNAQLYEAERRERILAQTLQKTAEGLVSSIRLDDTLNLIIDQLGEVIHYDSAMIMLVDEELLRVLAARGFSDQDQTLDTTYHYPGIPLFREAMATGEVIVLPDIHNDPRWVPLPGFESMIHGWIGVPLVTSNIANGLLSIGSNHPGAYSNRDVEAVTAFAQQAAFAIENARILAELGNILSALRETQAHLTRTARLSAAGEIAAGVAHQINNPLTTIIAETHLLLKKLSPDDPNYEAVTAIRQAAYRAGSVVQRLLDLSRTTYYDKQPLDINLSIRNSVSLIRAQIEPHVARLIVDLVPDLPPVEASEQHLEDVWLNLLLNARDAVSGRENSIIKVASRLGPDHRAVEITVQDNGPGIPAEYMEQMFTPFFTTKEYGTGLGLAICNDVIVRHGGTIRVENGEDGGAVFTVTLPTSDKLT